jgi:O-acetylhomoserine (thiol)-lyase
VGQKQFSLNFIEMNQLGFITKTLHTKYHKEDPHGALRMPVYESVAYEYENAEGIEAAFQGTKPGHVYSRSTNPTVEYLEQIIQNLTGAKGVIALSSGMAAISNLIIALVQTGDNIITSKHIFGNTYSLFEKTFKSLGIEFRYTDLTHASNISDLVDNKTRAVFFETVTNPMLEVVDVNQIHEITQNENIVLIADTSMIPLYLFSSKEFGIDIEVISSTKYISGGATSVGGLIIDYGKYEWSNIEKLKVYAENFGEFALLSKLRKEIYRNLGACLSPGNAFLQTLGLETLSLRAEKSCNNAMVIAEMLEAHAKVQNVNYPGLKSSKYHYIAKKQFNNLFGAIVTFDLSSKKQCFQFLNNLQIIRRATNLNDNKTLAIHPASTIFCEYGSDEREEMGVKDTMIRLAIGIEDCEDLKNDICEALGTI